MDGPFCIWVGNARLVFLVGRTRGQRQINADRCLLSLESFSFVVNVLYVKVFPINSLNGRNSTLKVICVKETGLNYKPSRLVDVSPPVVKLDRGQPL